MAIDIEAPGAAAADFRRALQLAQEGNAFPVSPVANERFFRTDRGIEYVRNAANTLWLSSHQIPIYLGVQASVGASAGGNHGRSAIPHLGVHSLWLDTVDFISFLSVAATWTLAVNYVNAANVSTLIASRATGSDAGGAWTPERVAVNAQLNAAARVLEFAFTETSGSATMFANAVILARLIG